MWNGSARWGILCPKTRFPFPKTWLEFLLFEESYISDSSVSNWEHFTDCLTSSTKYVMGFTASLFPCLLWPQLAPFSFQHSVPHKQTVSTRNMLIYRHRVLPMWPHTHTDISKCYWETEWYRTDTNVNNPMWHWNLLTRRHFHWQLIKTETTDENLPKQKCPSNIS